jgi:hypothetical protein
MGLGRQLIRKIGFMCSTRNYIFNSWGGIIHRPLVSQLYQHRLMIDDVGYLVAWELSEETEVLDEVLYQDHCMQYKS